MTEERFKTSCSFTIRSGNNPICKCMTDNGEYKSYSEWVDLLNTFAEENEQLKKDSTVLILANQDYRKENEKLRKALDEADDIIKSHLSAHYNRKWENICEYYGVDLE